MARHETGESQAAKSGRTRQAIVDAAGRVVRADGVANLTLERVAAAAGVSKGGLLYHFGSKRELIVGLLSDTLDRADEDLDRLAGASGRERGAFAQAYLDFVRHHRHDRGAATGVFAAAALAEGDLAPARARFAAWQDRLVDGDGLDPTVGLLARVVGDGLWLIDLFGLAPPDEDQRRRLFELVEAHLDGPEARAGRLNPR